MSNTLYNLLIIILVLAILSLVGFWATTPRIEDPMPSRNVIEQPLFEKI
tara:strand:+ start:907 stop:1053 length:147 start_codon:yes stop_codon:yes gene_type:complete